MYQVIPIESLVADNPAHFITSEIDRKFLVFPQVDEQVIESLDHDTIQILKEVGLPSNDIEHVGINELGFGPINQNGAELQEFKRVSFINEQQTHVKLHQLHENVFFCIDLENNFSMIMLNLNERIHQALSVASSLEKHVVSVAAYIRHIRLTNDCSREQNREANDHFFHDLLEYVDCPIDKESFWSRVWEAHEFV